MSKDEDWRGRYLEEGAIWEANEKLLRRAVSRLAIAAEGAAPELDPVLSRIQELVKRGDLQQLDSALVELANALRQLDSSEIKSPPTSPPPPPSLTSTTSVQTAAGVDAEELLIALIDEVAVLEPGGGSLATLRESVLNSRNYKPLQILNRALAEVRSALQKITREKIELEALVQQIGEELGELTSALEEEQESLTEGHADTRELSNAMQAGIERIRTHIQEESDIDSLKRNVSESLQGLRDGMKEFLERDQRRFDAAEARVTSLQNRVRRMEDESRALRQSLQENREQLLTDPLTGAGSRLAYDEAIARELSRSARHGDEFVLAVLDIDHFKRVNDGFGHSAGDKALQLVVQVIKDRIRASDQLFRVGGEEFVLLLPSTSRAQAGPVLETIRGSVESSEFHYENRPVPITLSAGLTAATADDTAESLYARADDCLYRAKKAGRNQVQAR
ncbi:MAG: diguanylate cyclase [Pseudomonadota bacterium]